MRYFNNEKTWNNFLHFISSGIVFNNKGDEFEYLVDKLLTNLFSEQGIQFLQTKMSHDGSKDFWAIDDDENLWWAECKNRNERLGLKELSPTLFMAELYEINHILFFSYSKLNAKVLRKIGLYALKHNKKVFIYDDDSLEYIILKYLSIEVEKFLNSIPDLQISQSPQIDTFNEKHPLLFNSSNFDGYYEIKEVEIGEIYNSNSLIINATDSPINIDISISRNKNFRIIDKYEISVLLEPFELSLITFKFQLIANNNKSITFPEVKISNERSSKNIKLNSESKSESCICKKGHGDILVGEHYEKIIQKATEASLKDKLSVSVVYGCGGSGKTRILRECYIELLNSISKILNFTNFDSGNNWKDVIREIVYNIFSIQDDVALDLLCNVENVELDNVIHKLDSNKKTVFKLLSLLNNSDTTEKEISKYYNLIFEKMRQGKYAVIIDNFQSYSNELVCFFEAMLNYYMNCNRNTNISLLFSINTDLIFDNSFSNFISKVINCKSNLSYSEFICEEIMGFETVEQAIVFLNSKLNLTEFPLHDELKKQIVSRGTLKPKILEQTAEYLINSGCIEIKGKKAFVSNEIKCRQCLSNIPSDYKRLIKYNYDCILNAYNNKKNSFKKIFAIIFLFGEITNTLLDCFNIDSKSIDILEKHGLLKNIGSTEYPKFVIEHDLTADCLSSYIYTDLLKVASDIVVELACNDVFFDETILILSELIKGDISIDFFSNININILETLPNRLKWHFAYGYVKIYVKYFHELDESFLKNVNLLCKYVDDQISTVKAENLFSLAYKVVSRLIPLSNESINELFSFYIHMAENKTHQGNFTEGLILYKEIQNKLTSISISNPNISKELDYAVAYILNRKFVCGKLEGIPDKYESDLKLSRKICLENGYWDIEFENCFDEANLYKNKQKSKFIICLEAGFDAFKKSSNYQKKKYMPNFLYKKIQYFCIKQEFEKAKKTSDKALEYIFANPNINYHIFFKTKYLKYKIICMLETNDIKDISKILQEYSLILDLYGKSDDYELLYFQALYFLNKNDKECLMMVFEKMYNAISKMESPSYSCVQMLKDLSIIVDKDFNNQFRLDKNNQHLKEINDYLRYKEKSDNYKYDSHRKALILGKNKEYGYYF